MPASKWISVVAVCTAITLALGAQAADSKGGTPAGAFSAGKFSCLQYTNGLGENSSGRLQSELAHLWMLGYLAGNYKAKGTLEFTDDAAEAEKVTDLMLQRCRDFPAGSILAVSMQSLAADPHKLPKMATPDFSPATYTCDQHVEAKNGPANAANKADLAELWAYAFIQGYKNVAQPDLEIPLDAMPQLTGAVTRSCGNNRGLLFMNLVAAVADKVKLNPGDK